MKRSNVLFIFDWDNTVILDNSDTLVFRKLAPEYLEEIHAVTRSTVAPYNWTQLIDSGLDLLHKQGRTANEIREAVSEALLPQETAAALLAIAHAPHACALVLSDANTEFISASLQKASLDANEIFEGGIFTNPAYEDEDGRIVLKPYIPEDDPNKQHGCGSCGKNLCKGEVLDGFKEGAYAEWKFVYVGDGGNDYCPVMRMSKEDAVLVRKGFRLHRKVVDGPPKAAVRIWESAKELQNLVNEVLGDFS